MSKDTYEVPGQIALAVATGRTEFIEGLINEVKRKHSLPLSIEMQVELLRMLKDMIDDRYRQQSHYAEMRKLVRQLNDFGDGVHRKAEELRVLVKKAEDAQAENTEEETIPKRVIMCAKCGRNPALYARHSFLEPTCTTCVPLADVRKE